MSERSEPEALSRLRAAIRDIPDFPTPGILFKDITPLLSDPDLFALAIDGLESRIAPARPEAIVAIESRGFIFGAPLALRFHCPFVPVRKPGKLPFHTLKQDYELEYGSGSLEAHQDALRKGTRVAIVDDLLATGGTALAAAQLVDRLGGEVATFGFIIELGALNGRARLRPHPVHALVSFDDAD